MQNLIPRCQHLAFLRMRQVSCLQPHTLILIALINFISYIGNLHGD
nr:MAG TPA: hypothetical protein [Caudoviricetes sp.]